MLKAAGFRIRYVNFARHPDFRPDLEGYNGLVVLGGPMGVYEADRHPHLHVEMKLIERALQMNIPVLGICLGAQLIASVLGSRVRKGSQWEMGWYDLHVTEAGGKDALFSHYRPVERVFQMHQDTFDIPGGCDHLAQTELYPGQAFRYGEKVYGLQFHLEADRAMILRWLKRPEHQKLIADSKGLLRAEELTTGTDRHIDQSLHLSSVTFAKFIEIFQLPERPILLGSTR
jgi:GMP synthase (glutamine-hydrolysing)